MYGSGLNLKFQANRWQWLKWEHNEVCESKISSFSMYLVRISNSVEFFTGKNTEFGASESCSSVCINVCLYLMRRLNFDWLWQVMWHKNYWWHHSMLSTRPNDSTSLVTSVKVSWLRPRAPEVSFENDAWLTHLPQL